MYCTLSHSVTQQQGTITLSQTITLSHRVDDEHNQIVQYDCSEVITYTRTLLETAVGDNVQLYHSLTPQKVIKYITTQRNTAVDN